MRGLRAGAILGALTLASCTGGRAGGDRGVDGAPTASGVRAVRLASGKTLPEVCEPEGSDPAMFPIAFAAGDHAWAVSSDATGVTCLFPTADAGPFVFGPMGDRALLADLEMRTDNGQTLHPAGEVQPGPASWGHPEGKAVVFVSPDGSALQKAILGEEGLLDISPLKKDVTYLNVAYHWSGLAIGFVVERDGRRSIWFASNLGEDARKLVFTREDTQFDSLAFERQGQYLFYGALHNDDRPELHRLDLVTGEFPGLWLGEPGQRIMGIAPGFGSEAVAFDVGTSCADAQAIAMFRGPEARPLLPEDARPTRVVGWLNRTNVVVASGPCDGPLDLSVVSLPANVATPLAFGVDQAAVRSPITRPTRLPDQTEIPPGAA